MHRNAPPASSTKESLALAMERAELHPQIIAAARDGLFDEIESHLPDPLGALVQEMNEQGAPVIAKAVRRGEFRATAAEREAWKALHGDKTGADVYRERMQRTDHGE